MSNGPFCVVIISQEREATISAPDFKESTEPEMETTEFVPAVNELMESENGDMEPKKKLGLQDILNTDDMVIICYSEDNKEVASRLRDFFFLKLDTYEETMQVEQTLAIIRPVLLKEKKDAVLEKIQQNGYVIEMHKELTLSEDQAHEFYKEQEGQDFFPTFVEHMTSGPVLALVLSRNDAVQHWRELLGPMNVQEAKENYADSLRAEFAMDDAPINQLHGSSSLHRAMEELEFFFPVQQTFAIIKPDAFKDHNGKY
ncbi:thioredoxin domain-containing protein 3-like [Rhinatrema bivittatum]|uniref:thioredoxin domain-containing protein 3-like n=1 Tax=Rhinatrema bivittatum TaxID=194408 RepID=UPI00112B4C90|nr:thioredoxin domain-containing protein 3-like [Rhinatrema bivittatum]